MGGGHRQLEGLCQFSVLVLEDMDDCEPEEVEAVSEAPMFKIGDTFKTYEELENKLSEYENFHYTKFWKREARTVEAASKRVNR